MMLFHKKKWSSRQAMLPQLVSLVFCGVIVYCEWCTLLLATRDWSTPLPVTDDTVTVLLVSDPQILSTYTEPYYPASIISVWDANRVLSKGFAAALHHSEASVVLFLGDLLNDGSVVDNAAFAALADHFKRTFATPPSVKLKVHIPGDNDIGGEWNDALTEEKVKRFYKAFPSQSIAKHRFLEFVHMPHSRSVEKPPVLKPPAPGVLRVVLSHEPLLPSTQSKQYLQSLHSSLLLSGHHHESLRFAGPRDKAQATHFFTLNVGESNFNFTLVGDDLHDIVVPTCSYRMGKHNYGFGMLQIGASGEAVYSVLWMPSRFTQLRVYAITAALCFAALLLPRAARLLAVIYGAVTVLRRRQGSSSSSGYKRLLSVVSHSSAGNSSPRQHLAHGYRRLLHD